MSSLLNWLSSLKFVEPRKSFFFWVGEVQNIYFHSFFRPLHSTTCTTLHPSFPAAVATPLSISGLFLCVIVTSTDSHCNLTSFIYPQGLVPVCFLCPVRSACPVHVICINLVVVMVFSDECEIWISSVLKSSPCVSHLLCPQSTPSPWRFVHSHP